LARFVKPREEIIETKERVSQKVLVDRLKRIEGQVRGLQRMIEEQRECSDVITQLLAARSALEQVGVQLLDQQLFHCLPGDEEALAPLRRSLRLWIKFGSSS
jgi:CsoR family transcriptional regulator, copper-sensing transcriptional repressor